MAADLLKPMHSARARYMPAVEFLFKVFIQDVTGFWGPKDQALGTQCYRSWPSPTSSSYGCAAFTTKQTSPTRYKYDFKCSSDAQAEADRAILTFNEGISCDRLVKYPIAVVRGTPGYKWEDVNRELVPLESVDPTRVPPPHHIRDKDSSLPGCFKPQKRCVLEIAGADGNTDVIVRGVCTLLEQYSCANTCKNGQARLVFFSSALDTCLTAVYGSMPQSIPRWTRCLPCTSFSWLND
jgi:hypothetical protein